MHITPAHRLSVLPTPEPLHVQVSAIPWPSHLASPTSDDGYVAYIRITGSLAPYEAAFIEAGLIGVIEQTGRTGKVRFVAYAQGASFGVFSTLPSACEAIAPPSAHGTRLMRLSLWLTRLADWLAERAHAADGRCFAKRMARLREDAGI